MPFPLEISILHRHRISMAPVAFEFLGIQITWYGICVASAFGFVWWRLSSAGARLGIPPEFLQNLVFVTMVAGILGARVLHVITHFDYFREYPHEIVFSRVGYDFVGGFLGAVPAAAWYCRRCGQQVWKVADLAAPYLAFAHGIGRIGCFTFGCCYGSVCTLPWAAHFHPESPAGMHYPGLGLHPVQLYETAALWVIAGILLWLAARRLFPGTVFLTYICLYSVARFILEFFRGDQRGQLGPSPLSPSQTIYLVLFVVAAIGFLIRKRFIKKCDNSELRDSSSSSDAVIED